MKLKTAFRYQNLINDLLRQAFEICYDQSNYQIKTETRKKSELNLLSLDKGYEDEVKEITNYDNNGYSPSFRIHDAVKKNYDFYTSFKVLTYLLEEKAKITNAIDKAKAGVKITPQGFKTPITYDSAIALVKVYRTYAGKKTILKNIKEVEIESTSTQKIIVSREQPPVDATYHIINSTVNDKVKLQYAIKMSHEAHIFAEDLSDKIEAVATTKDVNYTTDIEVTDNFDLIYERFYSEDGGAA